MSGTLLNALGAARRVKCMDAFHNLSLTAIIMLGSSTSYELPSKYWIIFVSVLLITSHLNQKTVLQNLLFSADFRCIFVLPGWGCPVPHQDNLRSLIQILLHRFSVQNLISVDYGE